MSNHNHYQYTKPTPTNSRELLRGGHGGMTSAMDNNDAELPHAYEDTSGRGIGFDETRGTSFPHSRSHQLKWKMKDMNHDSGRHSMLEDGEEEEIESEYVSQEEEKSEANNYDEAALDSQVAVQMENISEDANVQDRGNGTFPVNKQVEYEEQMQKAAALANEMTALKNSIENARVQNAIVFNSLVQTGAIFDDI